MPNELDHAQAEATQEVASAVLKAAGETMARHGNDPHSGVIVAAGFTMALRAIGKNIDPKVPLVVVEMLSPVR